MTPAADWRRHLAELRAREEYADVDSTDSADRGVPPSAAGAIGANDPFDAGIDCAKDAPPPPQAGAKMAVRAAALACAAEDAAAALAAPDPDLAHERQVIAEALATEGGPPVPEPQHRAAVAGHLAAGMQRPPAWANVSLTPQPSAWCTRCRGRRWWTERGAARGGWRCMVCRPPLHLRPEDVMERRT